jgi:hypothetical protein
MQGKYKGVTPMKLQGNLLIVAISGTAMVLALVAYALSGALRNDEPPSLTSPLPDINSRAFSSEIYATSEEAERVCPGRWVSAISPTDNSEHFRCLSAS